MALKKATTTKKTVAKKATATKTAVKKAAAPKKAAVKKTTAKKTTAKKAVKKAKPISILEKAATDEALDYINAACEALANKDEISPKALQEFAMQMFAFGVSSGASVAMLDRFSEMEDYLSL
ncbi:MAG: hypothetical protein K6A31_09000 [Fibrobacter sp.]|nr:hypothetical protein [Fibrobacter sp.]